MDSHAASPIHIDEGNEPLVVLLKSTDFGQSVGLGGELPYRVDFLRDAGFRLAWSDLRPSRRVQRILRRIEAATVPFAQMLSLRSPRRGAAATVAVFESEGHGAALARRLRLERGAPIIIVGCWLADLARDGGWMRRRLYSQLYRAVDAVIVFSENQRATLVELLGIESARIHVVRFGVDLDELATIPTSDDGRVVAVGRDLGRDWATLAAASLGSGWDVDLATRDSQVADLSLPPEITMLGRLDRAEYLRRLATARVVVVPTVVREYPTGQTVLLEAMALGKACVVTDTPAMREYVEHEETALLVPAGDPTALRSAVDRLLDDEPLRTRLGRQAATGEHSRGGARSMWTGIGRVVSACPVEGR